MRAERHFWRGIRHPLAIAARKGWRWGRGCLVSPRGTVFEVRLVRWGAMARRRREFQLMENER